MAGYGLLVVGRYIKFGDNTPLYGRTPMPFSSALWFVVTGLSLSWLAWAVKQVAQPSKGGDEMPAQQKVALITAVLSSITAIIITLIGVLKR